MGIVGSDRTGAGSVALDDLVALVALGIVLHPHADLVPAMWAFRDNLTAYDAAPAAAGHRPDATSGSG